MAELHGADWIYARSHRGSQHRPDACRFADVVVRSATSASSEGGQSWVHNLWYLHGAGEMQYGCTYVQAFVNTFVPRNFQGGLVDWQAAYIFRQFAGSENHGYDFSFSAEALMNFGPYGAFLPFVALGLFVGGLFAMWRNTGSLFYGSAYIAMLGILVIALRTDANSLFRFISLTAVPLVLATFVFGRYGWPNQIPAYTSCRDDWRHLFSNDAPPFRHTPSRLFRSV